MSSNDGWSDVFKYPSDWPTIIVRRHGSHDGMERGRFEVAETVHGKDTSDMDSYEDWTLFDAEKHRAGQQAWISSDTLVEVDQ